ncbi:MAG: response regulator [Vicinamibacterales bacterium]
MDVSGSASVMVVDDTLENLRLLSGMLTEHGYDVRPVTNGPQALQAAEHDPPDVILLDVNMPEMDGYEVCERLKQTEPLKDVPVIFLTALSTTADKVRAFNTGGVDYITKPFQIEEVLARVRVHVALRRARAELEQNYGRLRDLERMRDDLVHMVVHDMRSPLTVLVGNLTFLEADVQRLGEQAVQDLRAAVEGARSLGRMANDLLDISRLEDGKLPIVPERCDLAQIARTVADGLGVLDRARVIEVEASGPVDALCDAGLVRRVVENLVNNAIKHTPAGGRIRIAVDRYDGGARVTVEDEGPGVPLDARERIFEKFGTVASRKDQTYHSAGLGLAFCKLAVGAHGGSIGVESGSRVGSAFWFELPG